MDLSVKIKKQLHNFTLDVDFQTKEEVFALLGASGCGKSMTLKCIAGIEMPDSGRIVLNDRVLYDSEQHINLKPQQRRVGYLFQNYALFPNMTIGENLRFVAKGSKEVKEARVKENLARFSLEEIEQVYPHELSGGQQQRAAFARILMTDAELLLLDEPFSALDGYLKWQLELELGEVLNSYDGAALLVSHDRGEVYRLADRVAVINQGKMEQPKEKKELFRSPDTLAAMLLTGCKNVSKVTAIDAVHIMAEEWGFPLTVNSDIKNPRYAGIRAHFLELCQKEQLGQENVIAFDVVKVIEDTFSYLVMVRCKGTEGKPIRWELSKEEWKKIAGKELVLYFPPEKIMLMKE